LTQLEGGEYFSIFRTTEISERIPMSNLTKREIVLEIYRKSGFPQKQIVDTVQQTLDIVQKALANGRNVELRNFGVLEVQVRKQRIGRNPNKPEAEVIIPQRAVVKFKSGKILKQQLKKLDLAKLMTPAA
jgi:integration host factor subunit beta